MKITVMDRYKHLFFDLDDTFWDVRSNQALAQRELFETFSMQNHFADFDSYYATFREINQRLWTAYRDGIVTRDTLRNDRFRQLLAAAGVDDPQRAMDMSDEYMRIAPTFNTLMPNSIETLEYLYEKGYPMSLITNGFNESQFHKVQYGGMKKYFERITTSEFAGVNKPSPGIFEYAMRKAGVKPSECVMIGDDVYSDIYGGSSAGMDTIFLNYKGAEHDQQPTHEIRSLPQLRELL